MEADRSDCSHKSEVEYGDVSLSQRAAGAEDGSIKQNDNYQVSSEASMMGLLNGKPDLKASRSDMLKSQTFPSQKLPL